MAPGVLALASPFPLAEGGGGPSLFRAPLPPRHGDPPSLAPRSGPSLGESASLGTGTIKTRRKKGKTQEGARKRRRRKRKRTRPRAKGTPPSSLTPRRPSGVPMVAARAHVGGWAWCRQSAWTWVILCIAGIVTTAAAAVVSTPLSSSSSSSGPRAVRGALDGVCFVATTIGLARLVVSANPHWRGVACSVTAAAAAGAFISGHVIASPWPLAIFCGCALVGSGALDAALGRFPSAKPRGCVRSVMSRVDPARRREAPCGPKRCVSL